MCVATLLLALLSCHSWLPVMARRCSSLSAAPRWLVSTPRGCCCYTKMTSSSTPCWRQSAAAATTTSLFMASCRQNTASHLVVDTADTYDTYLSKIGIISLTGVNTPILYTQPASKKHIVNITISLQMSAGSKPVNRANFSPMEYVGYCYILMQIRYWRGIN